MAVPAVKAATAMAISCFFIFVLCFVLVLDLYFQEMTFCLARGTNDSILSVDSDTFTAGGSKDIQRF
jgi:hypothetical protein